MILQTPLLSSAKISDYVLKSFTRIFFSQEITKRGFVIFFNDSNSNSKSPIHHHQFFFFSISIPRSEKIHQLLIDLKFVREKQQRC
jgi:hypothetical protein